MKNDAMLDALRKKKGNGIDLTIILGDDMGMTSDSDTEDSEKLGLAPDTHDEMALGDQPDAGTDDELVAEEAEEGMKMPTATEANPAMHADEDQDRSLIRKMLEDYAPSKLGKMALASKKR